MPVVLVLQSWQTMRFWIAAFPAPQPGRFVALLAELLVQVEIGTEMMPGVVSLPHGWGRNLPGTRVSERPGINLNALLDENLRGPLSGNAVLSGVVVQMSALA